MRQGSTPKKFLTDHPNVYPAQHRYIEWSLGGESNS